MALSFLQYFNLFILLSRDCNHVTHHVIGHIGPKVISSFDKTPFEDSGLNKSKFKATWIEKKGKRTRVRGLLINDSSSFDIYIWEIYCSDCPYFVAGHSWPWTRENLLKSLKFWIHEIKKMKFLEWKTRNWNFSLLVRQFLYSGKFSIFFYRIYMSHAACSIFMPKDFRKFKLIYFIFENAKV